MDIANLIIRVTNEGLDRATRELRRLQENAAGAQAANERFGKSIADLNKLAMVGFGALTAVVGGSIKTAIDFEKAMAGVAKTVDFAADNGLANMKKGIEDLTKVIPLAFEELAEIASVGGSLGVVEEDILGFTETIAKMGVAFDISAGDAADSMAKIAGVFKIPIAEIGTLGDSINAVSNSVAATAGDVIEVMKRVGGTSGALKISADNTAALSGAMVALGLTPEVAGTAFNTLGVTLANFNDLTKTQASGFKRLGLDTTEFAALIQTDGVGAIKQVLEAAKELGGTDALSALNEAFGAEGIKILQMAEGLDIVDLALEQVAIDANGVSAAFGSMDAEFASVSGTTANKLQLVRNNMRLLAAGVGEAFLPAVNELILALVPVIEKMTTWAQANPELIVQIAKVTASVLGAIIAMAAISGAIGTVISTFQGLSAIFGVAKIAIMALSGPIGLTVIALGILVAAGALVYQNWDLIKQKATEIWGAITSYISNKINEIKNYFSTNFPVMTAIVSASIEIIKTLFVGGFALIKNTVTTVLGVIKAVISGDFKAIPGIIGNGLKTAAGIVTNMMGNILNIIKEYGKKLYSIGKDFIQGFINGIKSVGSGVASAASTMVGNAIAAVKKRQDSASPSKVTTKLGGDFSQGMANGIKRGKKAVVSEAQKMAEEAIKATQDGISSMQRELDLFGNSSKLLEVTYDIEIVGKYGGNTNALQSLASQLDDKEIKDNGDKLLSGLRRDFELLGETRPFVQWRNDFEDINNELSKMDDTLKLNILDAVTALDFKEQGLAIASANEDIDKQIMLLGAVDDLHKQSLAIDYEHNELMKGFEYMQQLGLTTAYESLKLDAEKLKAAKEHLVLITARKTATDAVTNSTDELNKQIALFGNDSPFAELNYDLEFTDKYLNASTQSVVDLQKAMQALAALNAEKAFKGVLDGNADDKSPIGKIMQEYDDKLATIKAYEDSHTALLQESVAARLEVERAYNQARAAMMVDSGEAIFGSVSSMAKDALGEQSGVYRAMFAVEKGFAIARSIMAIQTAMASATASLPFPANLPVIAQVAAQGASIISNIKAVAGAGFKSGGYTGNMGASQVAGVVHGQEYVFDAQSTKRIGVDNLNAMRSGETPKTGGDVNVNIINNSSAKVTASDDGQTITISDVRNEVKRGFTELSNPNSYSSKMVNRNVQAPRRR